MAKTIIYLAGSSWDAVTGTDKSLALALSGRHRILWVDPPVSMLRIRGSRTEGRQYRQLEEVQCGIVRLRTIGPPGVTRPVFRRITEAAYHQYIRQTVRRLGLEVAGTICSSPTQTFDERIRGRRLYYVTDDWMAGAGLMGLSGAHVERVGRTNADRAHVIAAVSGHLGQVLAKELGEAVEVVPNGCHARTLAYATDPGFPKAALVGQLNERLDFNVLEAVADTGIHIAVAGPKTAKLPEVKDRLDSFLARSNVHWHGVLGSEDVAGLLAASNVGLTPYTDTAFNRSSYPLKTLEYVAAGLAVVATDLPAAQFSPGAKVRMARDARDFAKAVMEIGAVWPTNAERAEQALQVREHTWDNRASQIRRLLAC